MEENHKRDLLTRFGNHLRSVRESKGISSAEMARQCHMDRGNYVRLETGQKDVQLSTLERIAKTLDISFEDFFKGF